MAKPLAPKYMLLGNLLRRVGAQPIRSLQIKFECVHCRDEFQVGAGDMSIPLCHICLNAN